MSRGEKAPAFTRENRGFTRSLGMAIDNTVNYEDDFHGKDLMITESGSAGPWTPVAVAEATVANLDLTAEPASGVCRLLFTATSEDQDAVIYHGDVRSFDVTKNLLFECRLALHVVPTLTAEIVFGMNGDHNLAYDSSTEHAWFKLDESAVLLCESDDTTNNNDDKDADSTTLVAVAFHVFQIDFSTIADVKFYVDGVNVGTGGTFDMSALTAAEAYMQPYFGCAKTSDAGLGSIDIDYVKIWCERA